MSAALDYTFASDNTAGLAPEALAALTAANRGSAPSYGDDGWTARAKKMLGEIFAAETTAGYESGEGAILRINPG